MDGGTWQRRVAREFWALGRWGAAAAGSCAAVVVALGAWRAGIDAWAAPAFVVLAVASAALAAVDARTLRLPDAILLPTAGVCAALLVVASACLDDWSALARAAVGAAITLGAHLALVLARPTGLGLGDVKLAGLLGAHLAWIGWPTAAVGAALPFLLGGLWAAVLLATRRATRSTAIPFGPFLVAGAAIAIVVPGTAP